MTVGVNPEIEREVAVRRNAGWLTISARRKITLRNVTRRMWYADRLPHAPPSAIPTYGSHLRSLWAVLAARRRAAVGGQPLPGLIQRDRPVASAKSHGCTSGGSRPESLRMAQICSRWALPWCNA